MTLWPRPADGRRFVCYFHVTGLWHWSIGIHLHLPSPNLELHVPFGFLRVGWVAAFTQPVVWWTFGVGRDAR